MFKIVKWTVLKKRLQQIHSDIDKKFPLCKEELMKLGGWSQVNFRKCQYFTILLESNLGKTSNSGSKNK